ncbi:MAG: tRNA dihydrouridine(20/20a) synthase DusA [Hydrogenophaga sp.]|nr:tRNA dihydrouridine(20/20a) synthase DusA [Hydrogenophaga sp.]
MMGWTDRHCRYFHRLLTRHTLLYTEMVTSSALIHGNTAQLLRFNDEQEHPVALQLGGSDPADLARATRLGQERGYDEINLNCGCPSERVQQGAFGACLMGEAPLVRDCVQAMREAVDVPVTVKHRIGIDKVESYDFVRDFVGTVADGGCEVFIVHARNAWLQGLSPKENREIPPLRYELAHRLKRDFPQLTIAVNGGITTPREAVELAMVDYMERAAAEDGVNWYSIACHMLGLRHGLHGARKWRQVWSDHRLKPLPPREVWALAQAHVTPTVEAPRPETLVPTL